MLRLWKMIEPHARLAKKHSLSIFTDDPAGNLNSIPSRSEDLILRPCLPHVFGGQHGRSENGKITIARKACSQLRRLALEPHAENDGKHSTAGDRFPPLCWRRSIIVILGCYECVCDSLVWAASRVAGTLWKGCKAWNVCTGNVISRILYPCKSCMASPLIRLVCPSTTKFASGERNPSPKGLCKMKIHEKSRHIRVWIDLLWSALIADYELADSIEFLKRARETLNGFCVWMAFDYFPNGERESK
jgi:hypothetical protein